MHERIRSAGLGAVRRHPRKAAQVAVVAGKHRKATRVIARPGREASRLAGSVKQVVANPTVQRESRLAVSFLSRAIRRARDVGATNVLGDKRLAGHLRNASDHGSKALTAARHPHARNTFRAKLVSLVAGVGALGGVVYTQWRAHSPQAGRSEPGANKAVPKAS